MRSTVVTRVCRLSASSKYPLMTSRYVPRVCGSSLRARVHTLDATHRPCPSSVRAGAMGGPETTTSGSFWPQAGEATRHTERAASVLNEGDFKAAAECWNSRTNSNPQDTRPFTSRRHAASRPPREIGARPDFTSGVNAGSGTIASMLRRTTVGRSPKSRQGSSSDHVARRTLKGYLNDLPGRLTNPEGILERPSRSIDEPDRDT